MRMLTSENSLHAFLDSARRKQRMCLTQRRSQRSNKIILWLLSTKKISCRSWLITVAPCPLANFLEIECVQSGLQIVCVDHLLDIQ